MSTAPAAASGRMNLSNVRHERQLRPPRAVIYGPAKVGKTTFAAGARSPILLGTEDGADNIDVPAFPAPENWVDVLTAVDQLQRNEHPHKTLILDTLDWLEPLLWEHCCKQAGKANMIEWEFQKGYDAALDAWRAFIARLDRLRESRGMTIIALAHAHVRVVQNPDGPDWDRWEMKLHKKASGLWSEWPEVIGFFDFEKTILRDKKDTKTVQTGRRLLYTTPAAAYHAGSRYSIPSPLAIPEDGGWSLFAGEMVKAFSAKNVRKDEKHVAA